MVAASRPALIQLEVSFVPALKDMNCKWTTPHVKVGLLLDHKAPTQCQVKSLYFLHVTSTVDVVFISMDVIIIYIPLQCFPATTVAVKIGVNKIVYSWKGKMCAAAMWDSH